jgi:hypothetical protein
MTMHRIRTGLALVMIAAGLSVSTNVTPAQAALPKVLLVGDSVMAAFNYGYGKAGLDAVRSGWDVEVDSRACRRLVAKSCRPNVNTALDALKSRPLPPTVVMTAGYNDDGNLDDDIDAVMTYMTANGVSRVVWLNYLDVTKPGRFHEPNADLVGAVKRWPQIQVVDWHAYGAGQQSWVGSDGVHLTGKGATALGQTIAWWLAFPKK